MSVLKASRRALRNYARLIALWKDCDSELLHWAERVEERAEALGSVEVRQYKQAPPSATPPASRRSWRGWGGRNILYYLIAVVE